MGEDTIENFNIECLKILLGNFKFHSNLLDKSHYQGFRITSSTMISHHYIFLPKVSKKATLCTESCFIGADV